MFHRVTSREQELREAMSVACTQLSRIFFVFDKALQLVFLIGNMLRV